MTEERQIEDLIDELVDAIDAGQYVELDLEQAIRFAWYCRATGWLWMEA